MFSVDTLTVIGQAESIIGEYNQQGFTLTLRQLYYQFVARALIPNTDRSYSRLGRIVSDARRAGMIDWDAIEDRTRFTRRLSSWDNPQDILQSARDSYHRDLWANQLRRLEVWIEKDALLGVIESVCQDNDVPFFSCRGYVSDSEMWQAAMRIRRYYTSGQSTIVLHLGDHDPSGIDMTRDITDRLRLFCGVDHYVNRIALTLDQIQEVGPPPNPAKLTDTRFANYLRLYGRDSWELDALEPQYMVNLVMSHIHALRDNLAWHEALRQQENERAQLGQVITDLHRQQGVMPTCNACGVAITHRRSDTRYCSPACRQKAYRQRRGT